MSETERVVNDLNAVKLMLCNPQMLTPEMCIRIGQAVTSAIVLLKEQEKAKVVFGRCKDGSFVTECGHCGMYLSKAYSICPKCNKELDWNSNQD